MEGSEQPALGLDTSVVLRLLTGQPEGQAAAALRRLEAEAGAGRPALVCDMVVAEAYYALHYHYGAPKREAARSLLDFLVSGLVRPDPVGVALVALRSSLSSSPKPGFVDRLIHAQYARKGAALLTFEHAATRLPNVLVLR